MTRSILRFVLTAAALWWGGAAHAALAVYHDRDAFLAAVGGSANTIDFSGSPRGGARVTNFGLGGMIFANCGKPGPDCLQFPPEVHWINDSLAQDPSVGTMSAGIFGFVNVSLDDPDPHWPTAIAVELKGDARDVAFSVWHSLTGYSHYLHLDGSSSFIGLVGNEILSGFSVSRPGSPADAYDLFYLDTVYTATAPVPEPQTLLLVAAGLAGIAWRKRRRNGAA